MKAQTSPRPRPRHSEQASAPVAATDKAQAAARRMREIGLKYRSSGPEGATQALRKLRDGQA